jgi:hypothetical protein
MVSAAEVKLVTVDRATVSLKDFFALTDAGMRSSFRTGLG